MIYILRLCKQQSEGLFHFADFSDLYIQRSEIHTLDIAPWNDDLLHAEFLSLLYALFYAGDRANLAW